MFFKELLRRLIPSATVPQDERRETIRLQCEVNVVLAAGGEFYSATLVNVTLTGLSLELESRLKPEQSVVISRDDFGPPLQGRVVWCRPAENGHQVGVEYEGDQSKLSGSWLQPALRQTGFQAELDDEKRKLVRIPGRVACKLKGLTGETYTEAEMLDLSHGGALVESAIELNEGLTIAFETFPLGGLPPLEGIAKIASSRSEQGSDKWRCGLRFTESKAEDIEKYLQAMLASK